MEELISMIPNVGFPIAITIFMLVKFDKSMQSLVLSQKELLLSVEKLYDRISDCQKQ